MSLKDRFRKLFQRGVVSEEAQRVYAASKSTEEVISGLEQLLGRNRIEYDEKYDELVAVSELMTREREDLRAGTRTGSAEEKLMDDIEVRQVHLASLKRSVGTLKASMLRHHMLVGRLREAQAAALRGVSEDDIDAILEKVNDEMAAHARDMAAGAVDDASTVPDPTAEEAARAERRRRLLGQESPAREAVATVEKAGRDMEPRTEVAGRKAEKE